MSCLPRFAIILALSLSCGATALVQSQDKPTKKVQRNSVSGRVTLNGKGKPGIVVALRRSDFAEMLAPLKATTDPDGNYQITNIPPGNYLVAPIAPAFVSQDFSPRGRGKALLLAEGEEVHDIDFSLIRGAVITGKVTDADGRPVVEERVNVSSEDQGGRDRPLGMVSNSFMTDDRGIYRIYGLEPGRYKISVGVSDDDRFSPIRPGRIVYRRTFYPDVTEAGEAKVIELSEGMEATNIDIALGRNLPGFSASGKIINGETGKGIGGVRFSLRRMINEREGGANMGLFIISNDLGEFRIENIPPGKYSVFLSGQSGSELRADPVFFEVLDHDVANLLLTSVKGLSIAGMVVMEGTTDKSVLARLSEMRLHAYVHSETQNFSNSQSAQLNPDGSFRIGGLAAGRANFSITGSERREPSNFSILRIERDGVVQTGGIEIKPGEDVSGVKVVLSYGTGSVRGEVKIANGPLPSGANVNVWLTREGDAHWRFRPQSLDARGRFLIQGVPAGEYELNVRAYLPGVRTQPAAKQTVTINDATVSEVTLTLDLGAPPNPN